MTIRYGGVYQIRNTKNNHIYIGSAVNLYRRNYEHFWKFPKNTHDNIYLQRSYNKYGEEAFVFEVLLICDKENLLLYEQLCLDMFKPEYNICKIAGNCAGRKLSAKSRNKISENSKKLRHTPETIAQMVESRKWYKHHSVETRKKISDKRKGFKFTKESRKKMSESHKGQIPVITKYWGDIKSPEGIIYKNVFNISKFCREHSVNRSCMMRICNGERSHHKGWTKA